MKAITSWVSNYTHFSTKWNSTPQIGYLITQIGLSNWIFDNPKAGGVAKKKHGEKADFLDDYRGQKPKYFLLSQPAPLYRLGEPA